MRAVLVLVLLASCCAARAADAPKPWSGGAAPQLELADLDGRTHRLSDYRGKAVLLNFWATWCAPCRAEMPSIERLGQAMAGKPFEILAVNVGESPRVAREFVERLPVTFTVLLDRDGRVTRSWGARVLPATYIVGPDGRIRYSHFGELDWSSDAVRQRIEGLLEAVPGSRAARD